MGRDTTKIAIAYAFKELLAEKPINRITINDIASRCDINRQTFYYHFHDIMDLTEWICETEGEKALKENMSYNSWQEGMLGIFDMLRKDRIFVENVYRHIPMEHLNKYLYKVARLLLYKVVDEKAADIDVSEEDKRFIADFYKYGFVGLVKDWIDQGMQEDPKRIVNRLNNLIEGTVENALTKATAGAKSL